MVAQAHMINKFRASANSRQNHARHINGVNVIKLIVPKGIR